MLRRLSRGTPGTTLLFEPGVGLTFVGDLSADERKVGASSEDGARNHLEVCPPAQVRDGAISQWSGHPITSAGGSPVYVASMRAVAALASCLALLAVHPIGAAQSHVQGSAVADAVRTNDVRSAGVACVDPQTGVVTDQQIRQVPAFPEPPARTPFRDPLFRSCVVRVTDRDHDKSADDPSGGLKNEYSKVQSFNADESRILVRGTALTWYVYDAATLQPITSLPIDYDPRWDAVDPNVLYFVSGPRLMRLDVRTQQPTVLHDFTGDFPGQTLTFVWTKYEGSPSRDGRIWGLKADDENYETVALLVYDQTQDRIIAKRDMRGVVGAAAIDNVTISPLGDYFAADFGDHYCEPGQLGTDAAPCGYMVYDRNLQNGRGLLRISGHLDLALDATGREVAVYQDIDTDNLAMLDLATGAITNLLPLDFSQHAFGLHISGRALDRPGWAVISTHDGDATSFTWMDKQIFLVELRSGGRVVRLAHHHSMVDPAQEHDYWAEPQASTNRDLTKVLFTTNWGRSGTDQVEMYMIELPTDWPSRLQPVLPRRRAVPH